MTIISAIMYVGVAELAALVRNWPRLGRLAICDEQLTGQQRAPGERPALLEARTRCSGSAAGRTTCR